MTTNLQFKCDHDPECSKPGSYLCRAEYLELWCDAGMTDVIVPDTQPENLVCSECNAPAQIMASEETKKKRREKIQTMRML
jgi:hypothetical protein